MYVCMYVCKYPSDVGVCVCIGGGGMGVLVKVFKKQKQKVVFVWYLGWDGDGGAHKKVREKKKEIY